jgi:hypothetical protein
MMTSHTTMTNHTMMTMIQGVGYRSYPNLKPYQKNVRKRVRSSVSLRRLRV